MRAEVRGQGTHLADRGQGPLHPQLGRQVRELGRLGALDGHQPAGLKVHAPGRGRRSEALKRARRARLAHLDQQPFVLAPDLGLQPAAGQGLHADQRQRLAHLLVAGALHDQTLHVRRHAVAGRTRVQQLWEAERPGPHSPRSHARCCALPNSALRRKAAVNRWKASAAFALPLVSFFSVGMKSR